MVSSFCSSTATATATTASTMTQRTGRQYRLLAALLVLSSSSLDGTLGLVVPRQQRQHQTFLPSLALDYPASARLLSSSTASSSSSRSCRHQRTTTPRPSTTRLYVVDDGGASLQELSMTMPGLPMAVTTLISAYHWTSTVSDKNVETMLAAMDAYFSTFPAWYKLIIVILPVVGWLGGLLYLFSFPDDGYRRDMEPYPRGVYDPDAAAAYYRRHPKLVYQRSAEILRLSNKFLTNLLVDRYVRRNEESQREVRAQELLELVTKLGPTAVKVGQALSVREDVIPAEFAQALATLQDQVPPFEQSRARAILRRELGSERVGRIRGIENGPVASASIGQVYKGKIGKRDVAIKVQRPDVLAEIALDLYIVREFAPTYQKLVGSATDLQSLANEWGRGFIAELDYNKEAENTARFTEEMAARNLNAVCAPAVLKGYSTERVLVTEWIDGTRLDESDAEDVPRLCAVALNAYLVMLLELRTLHCDPHPGNLLRTVDGKLCILDHGMVLDVDPSIQYTLLEFVAHLTADNLDDLPDDFVKLGFLREDKLEFAKRSGIFEPFKYFLKQVGRGGGAKGVRDRIYKDYKARYPGKSEDELKKQMRLEMEKRMIEIVERENVSTGITVEVEELQRKNRDAFRIPEWFLYTSRAFLTLEGVSLQADENYSIIKSCFPYIAKRLVGDEDPRARKALRDLLYGGTAGGSLDVKRVFSLANGFSSYTTNTKTISNQQQQQRRTKAAATGGSGKSGELVTAATGRQQVQRGKSKQERKDKLMQAEAAITLAKDSADILLAKDGNLVQKVFVDESALAASAQFKDGVRTVLVEGPQKVRDSLPLGMGRFIPKLPVEKIIEPFLHKTEDESNAQELAKTLATFVPSADEGSKLVQQQEGSNDKEEDAAAAAGGKKGGKTSAVVSFETPRAFARSLRKLEPEQAALVFKELRENLPKYAPLVRNLGHKFTSTLLETASKNMDTTLAELEVIGKEFDFVTKATVKGLSTVAQQGARMINNRQDREKQQQQDREQQQQQQQQRGRRQQPLP